MRCAVILLFFFLSVTDTSSGASAQSTSLIADSQLKAYLGREDLEGRLGGSGRTLDVVIGKAKLWRDDDCPNLDPKAAAALLSRLYDIQTVLKEYQKWTGDAKADALRHLKNHMGQTISNAETRERLYLALGAQDYLADLGSILLDLSALLDEIKTLSKIDANQLLSTNPLNDKTLFAQTVVQKLGSLNTLKSLYLTTIRKINTTYSDEELNGEKAAFNTLGTSLTAIDGAIHGAKALFERDPTRGLPALKSLGQVVGSVLLYVNATIKEQRVGRLMQAIKEADAQEIAQAKAYEEYRVRWRDYDLVGRAINKTKYAFDLVERARKKYPVDLVRRAASQKVREQLTAINAPGDKSYGRALRMLNRLMAELGEDASRAAYKFEVTKPIAPQLRLSKTNLTPLERLMVSFTAPACFKKNSWIAVRPKDVPAEDYAQNDKLGRIHPLRHRPAGEKGFDAPLKVGAYEVRMFSLNEEGGVLVASAAFNVVEQSPSPPLPARVCHEVKDPLLLNDVPRGKGRLHLVALDAMGEKTHVTRTIYAAGTKNRVAGDYYPEHYDVESGYYDITFAYPEIDTFAQVRVKRGSITRCVARGYGRLNLKALDGTGGGIGVRVRVLFAGTNKEVSARDYGLTVDLRPGEYDVHFGYEQPRVDKGVKVKAWTETAIISDGYGQMETKVLKKSGEEVNYYRAVHEAGGTKFIVGGDFHTSFTLLPGLYDVSVNFGDDPKDATWVRGVRVEPQKSVAVELREP